MLEKLLAGIWLQTTLTCYLLLDRKHSNLHWSSIYNPVFDVFPKSSTQRKPVPIKRRTEYPWYTPVINSRFLVASWPVQTTPWRPQCDLPWRLPLQGSDVHFADCIVCPLSLETKISRTSVNKSALFKCQHVFKEPTWRISGNWGNIGSLQ